MVVMISEMGFTLSTIKPTLNGSTKILNNHLVEWALTLWKNLLSGKGTYKQNCLLTQAQAEKYTCEPKVQRLRQAGTSDPAPGLSQPTSEGSSTSTTCWWPKAGPVRERWHSYTGKSMNQDGLRLTRRCGPHASSYSPVLWSETKTLTP